MIKKKYKVHGMHCSSCPLVIEGDLEDLGVKASCNFAKETLEVEFDQGVINEKKIQDTVKTSGYTISVLA
jgi:Cu+-exporting ATPase